MDKDNNWWKISIILSIIQMILFGYLDFIFVNINWFLKFGFVTIIFSTIILISLVLMIFDKKIGQDIGLYFSLFGIIFGMVMIMLSYLFGMINLVDQVPQILLFAHGVEPLVFLIFIVIPISLIYSIIKSNK